MATQNQVQTQAIESIPVTNPLEISSPISAIVNSQSPTAIIIAIGILIFMIFNGITKLVYVILINKPSK